MPRFDTLSDGSVVFEQDVVCENPQYCVDAANPRRLIPLFVRCKARVVILRKLECGLKRATFHCNKFTKNVTIGECDACQESER